LTWSRGGLESLPADIWTQPGRFYILVIRRIGMVRSRPDPSQFGRRRVPGAGAVVRLSLAGDEPVGSVPDAVARVAELSRRYATALLLKRLATIAQKETHS